jgi:hypothetical protein
MENFLKPAGTYVQLFVSADPATFALLDDLKASLEASSYGEVIRRALRAYRYFDPVIDPTGSPDTVSPASKARPLHVRIGKGTKDRLLAIAEEENRSLSDVVGRALSVFAYVQHLSDTMWLQADAGYGHSVFTRDQPRPEPTRKSQKGGGSGQKKSVGAELTIAEQVKLAVI